MTYAASMAASAYRSSQQLDQRPAAVLAAAHQELGIVLSSAIAAYRRRSLDEMCRHNARALQLLYGLSVALEGHSAETNQLVADYARLRNAINMVMFDAKEINTLERGAEWARTMTRSFLGELQAA
jgi:hypothetical protein